jgi:hypothetical protein
VVIGFDGQELVEHLNVKCGEAYEEKRRRIYSSDFEGEGRGEET